MNNMKILNWFGLPRIKPMILDFGYGGPYELIEDKWDSICPEDKDMIIEQMTEKIRKDMERQMVASHWR
jgi:hypothetical protein